MKMMTRAAAAKNVKGDKVGCCPFSAGAEETVFTVICFRPCPTMNPVFVALAVIVIVVFAVTVGVVNVAAKSPVEFVYPT